MNKNRLYLYIVMLIIGFIFISADINIETTITYPNQYNNSDKVIGEFQYYNIYSNYGGECTYKLLDNKIGTLDATYQNAKVIDKIFYKSIRIDILNDFIGFLLIIISCIRLSVCSRKFVSATLCAVGGFIIHAVIVLLPFLTNGLTLCYIVLVLGIIYLMAIICTTYLFTGGLLEMCPDISCRDERKWGKICWFITCVLQILITFVFWLGSDFKMLTNLGIFFEIILVLNILILGKLLYRTYEYLNATYQGT